jgi:hypothetical protein
MKPSRNPSRATVVTAGVAIGVFGAGIGLGAIISARSQPVRVEAVRLAEGTYHLDDQSKVWTFRASAGGPAESRDSSAEPRGDTRGEQRKEGRKKKTSGADRRVCLMTTPEGRVVEAGGADCTPIPVLAPAGRRGEPANRLTAQRRTPALSPSPAPCATGGTFPAAPRPEPPSPGGTPSRTPNIGQAPDAAPGTRPTAPAVKPTMPAMRPAGEAVRATPRVTPPPAETGPTALSATAGVPPTAPPADAVPGSATPSVTPCAGSTPIAGPTPGASGRPTAKPAPANTSLKGAKVLSRLPDGTMLVQRPGGERLVVTPDGRVFPLVRGPWDEVVTVLPDGSWLMVRPNGERVIVSSDGSVRPDVPPTSSAPPSAPANPTPSGRTPRPVPSTTLSDRPTLNPVPPASQAPETPPAPEPPTSPIPPVQPPVEEAPPESPQPPGAPAERTSEIPDTVVPSAGPADTPPAPEIGPGENPPDRDTADEGGPLPVFEDPELLKRAQEALGLDKGMRYTDENGVWDLNIAPPGTPPCRTYSAEELAALRSPAGDAARPLGTMPRDSCAWPAFIRWLYADPEPGGVSNWTTFTGLPDRNLELVVIKPSTLPPVPPGPGDVAPDQAGVAGP